MFLVSPKQTLSTHEKMYNKAFIKTIIQIPTY